MYMGHIGIGLGARRISSAAPLWIYLVAALMPDFVVSVGGVIGIGAWANTYAHMLIGVFVEAPIHGACLLAGMPQLHRHLNNRASGGVTSCRRPHHELHAALEQRPVSGIEFIQPPRRRFFARKRSDSYGDIFLQKIFGIESASYLGAGGHVCGVDWIPIPSGFCFQCYDLVNIWILSGHHPGERRNPEKGTLILC